MGDIPPEVFATYLEQQRTAQARDARMGARRVLAEMVRHDAAERPMTWRRRRAYVRYAERLGLESFEARLLVRAAEFAAAGGSARPHEQVASEFLAEAEAPGRLMLARWGVLALMLANALALCWVLHRAG
jgi:hypothetical protein